MHDVLAGVSNRGLTGGRCSAIEFFVGLVLTD
jgi:hypothetical protein